MTRSRQPRQRHLRLSPPAQTQASRSEGARRNPSNISSRGGRVLARLGGSRWRTPSGSPTTVTRGSTHGAATTSGTTALSPSSRPQNLVREPDRPQTDHIRPRSAGFQRSPTDTPTPPVTWAFTLNQPLTCTAENAPDGVRDAEAAGSGPAFPTRKGAGQARRSCLLTQPRRSCGGRTARGRRYGSRWTNE